MSFPSKAITIDHLGRQVGDQTMPSPPPALGDVALSCLVHLNNIEANVATIEGKLYGFPSGTCQAAQEKEASEPPMHRRLVNLEERLQVLALKTDYILGRL